MPFYAIMMSTNHPDIEDILDMAGNSLVDALNDGEHYCKLTVWSEPKNEVVFSWAFKSPYPDPTDEEDIAVADAVEDALQAVIHPPREVREED